MILCVFQFFESQVPVVYSEISITVGGFEYKVILYRIFNTKH